MKNVLRALMASAAPGLSSAAPTADNRAVHDAGRSLAFIPV